MKLLDKDWKSEVVLVLISFTIYFVYLHHIFLNINSLLSSITGDTIKNYYTFVYHIKNDKALLHFTGMNFPYGEHVIYTDCQPLFTFILKLLPFTENYLIGIMHSLIFLSFIFTPLVLFRILKKLDIDQASSFFIALAIGLLSPQFEKINSGHHALAYGCVVPISLLLFLNVIQTFTRKSIVWLFSYNVLLFLVHPYLGLAACIFCLVAFFVYGLLCWKKQAFAQFIWQAIIHGLVPVFLFKVFMKISDHHSDRISEPYGNKDIVENIDTLMAPDFGPFRDLMNKLFPNKIIHFEGHSYLGFFTIVLSLFMLFFAVIFFRKLKLKREMTGAFLAGFVLLLVSFGLHMQLLDSLGLKVSSLSQFRANSRFAWYFYFMLPLFLVSMLYHSLKVLASDDRKKYVFRSISVLYFLFQGLEAHAFLQKNKDVFWKSNNFFRTDLLNNEEKSVLKKLQDAKPQAIVPLPIFHAGSEMFTRVGFDNSMIPAIIYSYHANVPILSGWLSRTSIHETAEAFQLLNTYKKSREALSCLNDKSFLVIKTKDLLLPREESIGRVTNYFLKNDSLEIGLTGPNAFSVINPSPRHLIIEGSKSLDSNNVIYTSYENRKPFELTDMKDFGNMYALDSNLVKPGKYIVSFHYHYSQNTYQAVGNNIIISHRNAKEFKWQYYMGVNVFSGFYPGFGVYEYEIELENGNQYDFVLNGYTNQTYHVSDFMLRPADLDVILTNHRGDTVMINNFPR